MDLDDLEEMGRVDHDDMYSATHELPEQLLAAWQLGQSLPLPPAQQPVEAVLISGMGGSAIGADFLATYAAPRCRVPVVVRRGYGIPAWARNPRVCVIASSHSGNTEETLSAYEEAREAGAALLALCTGGELAERARHDGVPCWLFEHQGQPRAAVGYSFGLLLALMVRLGLLPDAGDELRQAVGLMQAERATLGLQVPVDRNPAKRMAGQLVGRWVTVLGSDYLAPVARRWKTQINELAKAWSQWEELPEANHNTLAGIQVPEELLVRMMALFLRAPSDHPRNARRSELTRQAMMQAGINTDTLVARGETPLAHMGVMIQLGDHIAYYLAQAYGIDPTPVEAIEEFKLAMREG